MEQSDQGNTQFASPCIFLTKYPKVLPLCLNFRYITAKFSGVQKFRNIMVYNVAGLFFGKYVFAISIRIRILLQKRLFLAYFQQLFNFKLRHFLLVQL